MMNKNIGPQMIKSICKSKAYGESAENTAAMHGVSVEDVEQIWKENAEKITEYVTYFKSLQEGSV
jgi:hypothetical protein